MAKPILPEALRENIKELFGKGYTQDAVFRFVKGAAQKYVESGKQLNRCLVQIRSKVPVIPKKQIAYSIPPWLLRARGLYGCDSKKSLTRYQLILK